LRNLRRSPSTLRSAARWLADFARFCQEQGCALEQLTPEHLGAYHRRLLWTTGRAGRLYAAHSVQQALQMVRAFLRWALPERTRLHTVWRLRSLPAAVRPRWSPAEQDQLLAAIRPDSPTGLRDRALLELLLREQLGLSLVSRLDLADLSPDGYRLRVVHHKGRLRCEERTLPDCLAAALLAYRDQGRPQLAQPAENALFVGSHTGQRLTPLRLSQIWRHHTRGLSS
jgi:integrase/recombinase XerD